MADGSGNDYERKMDALWAALKAGGIDEHTAKVKSARLLLNQVDTYVGTHLITAMLAASDDAHDQMTAAVLTVLAAQIVRLEDDVERLRIEVAKERTARASESKFVDEYGLGSGSGGGGGSGNGSGNGSGSDSVGGSGSVGGDGGGSDNNTESERSGE